MVAKTAILYRMKTPDHICPFGLKSKDLLKRNGYNVEDHPLTSREETDRFMAEHDVKTTPQTFIDGERVGGYDDLRSYFSMPPVEQTGSRYQPVIVVFAVAFLMAVSASIAILGQFSIIRVLEWFIAFSMCILAILKLRDLYSFTNQFLGYDLLAQRFVPYAYIYPFAEAFAGIAMLAGVMAAPVAAPVALFIGTVGAVSVYKAVYIDKRDLKCACVGGKSNVPLGFVSLTENLMMMAMGLWMIIKWLILIA